MGNRYKNILMVYPEFEKTYWGRQYKNELTGKRALMPPLGLITIAALTPDDYEIRLVDLNCEALGQSDLDWADMVCFSAMLPQKQTLQRAATRCRGGNKLVVFGGPYPTSCPEECAPYCDVLVLDEGEMTWPRFLEDLESGSHHSIYRSEEKPDVSLVPTPRFDLLKGEYYQNIPVQFSRGCPFLCEFCDITVLFGRLPRTKTAPQFLAELDAIYATGHRGPVFVVDDNFIGNKKAVKMILPEIKRWNEAHGHPFNYGTEASVNVADDHDLLRGMVEADFKWVFIGIETPSLDALKETRKVQNLKGSLIEQVRRVQEAGLIVHGGFIVGFDSDGPDIFDRQIEFITKAAIAEAMIGPLSALPGTPLFKRLQDAGRLIPEETDRRRGGGFMGFTNIETLIPRKALLEGYLRIITTLYQPGAFLDRVVEAFRRLPDQAVGPRRLKSTLRGLAWVAVLWLRTRVGPWYTPSKTRGGAYETLMAMTPEVRRACLLASLRAALLCPRYLGRLRSLWSHAYHFHRFTFEDVVPQIIDRIEEYDQRELPAVTSSLERMESFV